MTFAHKFISYCSLCAVLMLTQEASSTDLNPIQDARKDKIPRQSDTFALHPRNTLGDYDYDIGPTIAVPTATTPTNAFTWPSLFVNPADLQAINGQDTNTEATLPEEYNFLPEEELHHNLTDLTPGHSFNYTDYDLNIEQVSTTTAKPRKPGLHGALEYIEEVVPDSLSSGKNTTSILGQKSVGSILKIIGSVAFLNLSGIIDNAILLGTSNPVREIVFGATGIVFCNPLVTTLRGTPEKCT